jgi:halocyanin-like protein
MRDCDRDSDAGVSRRTALRRTLGAGAAGACGVGTTPTVGAQEDDGQDNESGGQGNESDGSQESGEEQNGSQQDELEWGEWFEDVENFDGTQKMRGQESVSVAVGAGDSGLLFDPPAIWVDQGTTVVWEWTGEGGGHNVEHADGEFASEIVDEEGFTFEYTFEATGVFRYFCNPHRGVGMKGGVAVGDNPGEGGGGDEQVDDGGSSSVLPFVAAAFVVGFLSPLLFVVFLYSRGRGGREREYGP